MRIGLVGCGLIARIHARAIAATEGAQLVACCSRRPHVARTFAADAGCEAFDSVEAMLRGAPVDAVAICSPSGAHLEPALVAARAGRHVLVEKPLEISPQRCDQIIEAAAAAGVVLATVFQSRCAPVWQALRRAIADGDFGSLSVAEAHVKWFRSQEYYDSAAWRGTWELDGGGALMNQAIHTVDLLLWLMGPVRAVGGLTALRAHQRIEVEDTAVATLEFSSGALGLIAATTASCPGRDKRIEIHGSAGSAIIEEDRVVHWSGARENPLRVEGSAGSGAADPAAIGYAGHAAVYEDFLRAVHTGAPPAADGREGRRSVELIVTIYRAAREGRVIRLD